MPYPGGRERLVFRSVLDYHFVINGNQPVSFAELPIKWNKEEIHPREEKLIFLNGTINGGLKNICKQVVAWKFELSREKEPIISVLSKDGQWYVLVKARKRFTEYIRTILITVHFLHFVRWNPQKTLKALWHHLSDTLSMFSSKPSAGDLSDDHLRLIIEAVKRDEAFTKSKHLVTFLKESIRENPDLIEENNNKSAEDDESKEDDVCAFCDNGGNLFICEGKCMRSFHPTVEEGADSSCPSLGFTKAEYNAIEKIDFYCKNCQYEQHQCFVCGELGSSNESSIAEVFQCVNESCGCFYHPHCVAKLLHPSNEANAKCLEMKIAKGEKFTCPRHVCLTCKGFELNPLDGLQFAFCRRCPRAYHTKCLPRKIAFEEDANSAKGIVQRAWSGLLPNKRVLIYCLKHEIDIETSTPSGVHIKFPESKLPRSFGGQNVGVEKDRTQNVNYVVKKGKSLSTDTDLNKRVSKVMKKASPSSMNNATLPCVQSLKLLTDIAKEKMEGFVKAISAALEKLEEGSSIDDAKTFCESDLLIQIIKWKGILRTYLATILGGMHYTSFSRHFTRKDKLNEMVDKLHCYVEHGDVIADFCCGTNNFCRLMKKKLKKVGKSCTLRKFDILKAENCITFEGKECVEKRQRESIEGSRLIMVSDPSSGVDADHDDECIEKSLKLKPKLLILVAPRGMSRLDKMDFSYELIWEDDKIFADDLSPTPVGEQMEEDCDSNVPVIYLWSCPNWTTKLKVIAEEHDHLSLARKNSKVAKRRKERSDPDDCHKLRGTKRKKLSIIADQSKTPSSETCMPTLDCEPSASEPHGYELGFALCPFSRDNSAGWLEE